MKIQELLEDVADNTLPSEPGTEPIPQGTVRLYHQTDAAALQSIVKNGLTLANARGIEGPKAIYASETGFYGKPGTRPTLEFYVDQKYWDDPFVLQDIPPTQMIAAHLPWHSKARYIETHPDVKQAVLAGKHDDLKGDYAPAVAYIKQHNKPALNTL